MHRDVWLEKLQKFAADCPEKIPPHVPERLLARDRGFADETAMKKAARIGFLSNIFQKKILFFVISKNEKCAVENLILP